MKKNRRYFRKETLSKLYLEASRYSLDLSKLIFGGIILSGIMGMQIEKAYLLIVGLIAVILTALFGFIMFLLANKK
jgi:putative ABC transporter, permease/ATP-binding protein